MPEETKYLGYTPQKSDGYMEPDRYRVKCRCLRCGHEYSRVYKVVPTTDPPCPKKTCKEAIARESAAKMAENVEAMIESGEAPGHIGDKVIVKAIDETAKIVMEDLKMTDLKDRIKPGETMVPPLTLRQQKMSQNFWGGARLQDRKRDPTYQLGVQARNKSIIDNAMKGNYIPNVAAGQPSDAQTGDNVLRQIHGSRYKPPVEIIYDANRGKKS
jgi:hypothetical protein